MDSVVQAADSSMRGSAPAETEEAVGRPVRATIDLSAVAANTRAVKRLVGPRCRVMAVVKADGYGLGAQWVSMAAIEGGASWLGVACVDEGIQLRRAGYTGPLLVMSYVPPEEAAAAVAHRLTLVLHNARTGYALVREAERRGLGPGSVAVHVKVDTGLGRFGCMPHELSPLLDELRRLPAIRAEGLMTHFADADSPDLSFAREQLRLFNQLRAEAEARGHTFDLVHAANSAAAISLPESRLDMVRVGILLSGHVPSAHLAGDLDLRPAIRLTARLARVFEAPEGYCVGYGRTWRAPCPSLVGLVPVGYADGYSRQISNRGQVLVKGVRCPVVGRVSMDQIGVDLSAVPGVAEGDEVVLIGRQGEEEIDAADLARWAGTISYEVLCGLSPRVPRTYVRDGEPLERCTLLGCRPVTDRPRPRKELSR
ncbi:MAG TPA: alanine racemase [Chloroflexia bacterium]|nr:alanine racemase [Chloroflexia bacterium]